MTNEQIQQKREEMLAGMSEAKRAAYLEAEAAHDRLMAIEYSEKLGVPVEIIPNDPNHIRVDGRVMGYNEFQAYCEEHLPQEEYDEEDEDWDDEEDYDDDEDEGYHGSGWFNA
jgi:hypothetical protein